tara:strand:- start:132 stop:1169 length:1038 start_codon:yes stop_codon:yes gene_type:complete
MKKIFSVIGISLIFALVTDLLFGSYLLKFTPKKIDHTTSHNFYDHDLKKSFRGNLEWSPGKSYLFCSNKNSFRTFCDKMDFDSKEFDIAFIGDSFTEGVGIDYEDTFVGRIENNFEELKIANLGVVSYSPSIYFTKLRHLLENGYKFKRVIIYFDISDIYDDNRKYRFIDDKIRRKKSAVLTDIQRTLKSSFPFLAYSLKTLKNDIFKKSEIVNKCNYLDYCHEKSSWTFNDKFFGDEEINKSLKFMEMTYELLQKNNIKMSVGIYPWPAQILYDNSQSKIVKLMSNFCINKCEFFFDNFTDFFNETTFVDKEKVISKYYIEGDVHFNSLGNEKIFKNFIRIFRN